MPKTTCRECKHCNLKESVCDADLWDRNAEDETWLHSEDDFNTYLDADRLCSEREVTIG